MDVIECIGLLALIVAAVWVFFELIIKFVERE